MNALIPAILAFVAILAFSPAYAEDHAAPAVAPAAEAPAAAAVAVTAEPATVAPEHYTYEDGTAVIVEGGMVFTVAADGTRAPATDGDHVTKEGKTLKVMAGALVPEPVTEGAVPAPAPVPPATNAAPTE